MTQQNFQAMRRAMVESQLRTNAVNDPAVVAAMASVPREWFVPPPRAAVAYIDRPIPLGDARQLNTPLATGRLLTEARVRRGDRALVVGAATGYSAALLAELGASVIALESDPALAEQARSALAGKPVEVVDGPLPAGHADGGPYDLILFDGAIGFVPPAIVDQLADGGRVACALIDRGVTRLAIGIKGGAGKLGLTPFADVEAVPLPGFAVERGFRF